MGNHTWTQLKSAIAVQMQSDPQRATLASRAVGGVEEGLRYLASVGEAFEIVPRGTLAGLQSDIATARSRTLSIAEASGQMGAPAAAPGPDEFEARGLAEDAA